MKVFTTTDITIMKLGQKSIYNLTYIHFKDHKLSSVSRRAIFTYLISLFRICQHNLCLSQSLELFFFTLSVTRYFGNSDQVRHKNVKVRFTCTGKASDNETFFYNAEDNQPRCARMKRWVQHAVTVFLGLAVTQP